MALQKEITKVSVKDAGEKFQGKMLTITLNLTCWPEAMVKEYPIKNADSTIDMKNAIIFRDFSASYKDIDGMTVDEQITRAARDLKGQMQSVIDVYIREQVLLAHVKLDEAVTWIETTLEG